MKVRVLRKFKDKHTGKMHMAGETITVTKERFEEILTVDKLVEEVTEEATEDVTEEATEDVTEEVTEEEPKKTARKATKKSAE